jgi:membrane protease YdiL (CAAX protease family)
MRSCGWSPDETRAMRTARQIRALLLLLLRNWLRRALRPGEAPKRGFPSTFLLNLASLAFVAPQLWNIAGRVGELGPDRLHGVQVGLWGLLLLNAATALSLLTPEIGRMRSPLRHSLLDELPVSPLSILTVTWVQGSAYGLLSAVYLLGISPRARDSALGIDFILAFTVALTAMACALGMALVSVLRASLASHRRRQLVWIYFAALAGGVLLVMVSPHVAGFAALLRHDPMRWLARGLLGHWRITTLCAMLLLCAAGVAITLLCELRGYDRIDLAPPNRVRETSSRTLDMAAVEARTFARESGQRVVVVMSVFGALLIALLVSGIRSWMVLRALAFQVVYLAIVFALQFSSAMVRRDLGARAFLSALPITPYQTLHGKIRALRLRLAPVVLMALPFAWVAVSELGVYEVAWRFVAFAVSVFLLCGAAVPVAFLSNGLGAPSVAGLGASGSFATLLLSIPVLTVTLASNPIGALVSLAMLAAIGIEARRSAVRCVHWIDDAGDVQRDTAVWRALLVLATFFATQGLIAQLLTSTGTPQGYVLAITYGAAALILALLTHQQRSSLPPLRFMPRRRAALLLGPLAGAASALASVGFIHLLVRLGWEPTSDQQLDLHGGEMVAVSVAVIAMAPLAEEIFFRGWLQRAIAAELVPERRHRAILYGALAFAAVHFGSVYVPQFILGLLAGALYAGTGGLLPGILAHAVHNGLATFLSR